jgi:hypothetical protein
VLFSGHVSLLSEFKFSSTLAPITFLGDLNLPTLKVNSFMHPIFSHCTMSIFSNYL